ncbi:PAP2 superfamily protein [Methylobacterium sp. 275MFSha3.1]|uniref:phosphatase PAP2 family protein n=1 Tax=Methylobacterium sp. 275MFSha3.1 TaxID=1502746 RepID=UPI0008A7FFD9|nr:phosphatase PAP2 family protein [Methylobacterium sp. 275MFSha3.1]SEH43698.1 PAP2 superfamily protein [Methylobacterium sp. 275MFSha3.1]
MFAERPRGGVGAWPLIAATLVATIVWMAVAGLHFAWDSALVTLAACGGLEALARVYRTRRPEPRIAATLSALAQVIAFSACAAALSYTVASTGGPLWDSTFDAWDRRLGLDWRAYLAFVDGNPRLGLALSLAYRSLILQTMLAVILLGFSGRLRALRDFVLAFALAGTVTVLISALTPALANFVYLGLSLADFPNLHPAASYVHVADLTGLRDGTLRTISLDHVEGIITFPSFHAALGALYIWAFWHLRAAQIPALLVNVLLIAATPIDGGHYFVDVIAGLVIAVLAICAARALGRRWAADAPSPGAPEGGPAPGRA